MTNSIEQMKIYQQEIIEDNYARQHLDGHIRKAILLAEENRRVIADSVQAVQDYINKPGYYGSKQARVDQLKEHNLEQLVISLLVGVAYYQRPELFSSAVGQLASRLGFDSKEPAIKTTAELLGVMAIANAFDISKENREASLMIISTVPLSKELLGRMAMVNYLPPMVCKPATLKDNRDTGYLSIKNSVILGSGNHHGGELCLDVLNIMNGVALKLNEDLMNELPELPKNPFESIEQERDWSRFMKSSRRAYKEMLNAGNEFYLTHRVDKRGRIYSQGYEINTQGAAYKKAMLELSNEQLVEGVPEILGLPA